MPLIDAPPVTNTIALQGGGEAQRHFYVGGLIIFVKDCGYVSSLNSYPV